MNPRRIVKMVIPRGLFRKVEPYGHLAEAVVAQTIHGFPARHLKVIGVTGTDGKTSTCTLIAQMLREAGYKVALSTTISIDYGDGKGEQPNPTHRSTVGALPLMKMIQKIKANDVDWLVLETTSHALAQYRVWGIPYSVGVMTNISPEHLDYHGTFERYLTAKLRLFKLVNRNKKGLRVGIANADDPKGSLFAAQVANPVLYGIKDGDLQAKDIKLTATGSHYKAHIDEDSYSISCHLPGEFNVYNSLAAVAVGRAVGLSKQQIEQGIASLSSVAGRMSSVDSGQKFAVYVDYAVTPAALENVLKATRKITKGRVIIVFGATGDRDKAKRPEMGKVTAKLADYVFVTDDETYTEDPATIRTAVMTGIEQAGGQDKCQEIADRRAAIKAAIAMAKAGDSILITGMGHQTTRNMGGKDQSWSDTEVAKKLLTS